MTVPLWSLLAFAAWTLLTLSTTVGVYRWNRILTGRARIATFAEFSIEGAGWYKRAMRAHANCVENLPVFGALVLVVTAAGREGGAVDVLCLVVIGARVPHTLVHVLFEQTNTVVAFRSAFFNIQWLAMFAMAVVLAVGG